MTENDKLYEFVLKPEVVFLHIENLPIVVGWHAIIYTLNHPVYGVGKVRAGWVLNAWEDDNHNVVRFETKDAYYVVASGDDNASETTVSVVPLRPQDKGGATVSVECVAYRAFGTAHYRDWESGQITEMDQCDGCSGLGYSIAILGPYRKI